MHVLVVLHEALRLIDFQSLVDSCVGFQLVEGLVPFPYGLLAPLLLLVHISAQLVHHDLQLSDTLVHVGHFLLEDISLFPRLFKLRSQLPLVVFFLSHASLEGQDFFLSLDDCTVVVLKTGFQIFALFLLRLQPPFQFCKLVLE